MNTKRSYDHQYLQLARQFFEHLFKQLPRDPHWQLLMHEKHDVRCL